MPKEPADAKKQKTLQDDEQEVTAMRPYEDLPSDGEPEVLCPQAVYLCAKRRCQDNGKRKKARLGDVEDRIPPPMDVVSEIPKKGQRAQGVNRTSQMTLELDDNITIIRKRPQIIISDKVWFGS